MLNVCYFTWFSWVNVWKVPSEFAWLLCATALSVLFNQCTEKISHTYIICLLAIYNDWYVQDFIQSVQISQSFYFAIYFSSPCSLQHNWTGESLDWGSSNFDIKTGGIFGYFIFLVWFCVLHCVDVGSAYWRFVETYCHIL